MTAPTPVIIDSDPGVDDAVAILLALASPEVEVKAIHTVAGNVPLSDTTRNALKVLELAGRTEVPVHAGCSRPMLRDQVFGKYAAGGGLAGDTLPPPGMRPAPDHAVDHLVACLRRAAADSAPLTVCTLGPLTNIGLALAKAPDIVAGIGRIISMGGAFTALGNRRPWAEFNFLADPHAARIVLNSGVPVEMLPLDVTFQALATPERLAAIAALENPVADAVCRLITYHDRGDPARFGVQGGPLHDPLVIARILWPDLFQGRPAKVTVETGSPGALGHTIVDWKATPESGANAIVFTRLDAGGFFVRLTERLARY